MNEAKFSPSRGDCQQPGGAAELTPLCQVTRALEDWLGPAAGQRETANPGLLVPFFFEGW